MDNYDPEQLRNWSLYLEQQVDKGERETVEKLARELQSLGGRALRKKVALLLMARSELKASHLGQLGFWQTFD